MNKDALLATLIGFAIGLTITGIIIVAPTLARSGPKFPTIRLPSLSFNNSAQKKPSATPIISSKTQNNTAFAILSPIPDSIAPKNPMQFEGTADSKATAVIIQTDTDDTICPVKKGNWSCQITLSEGKNDITVNEIRDKTITASKTISLFYTAESL